MSDIETVTTRTTLSAKLKLWLSLTLIICMCWASAWGIASLQYMRVMDQWITEGRAQGYDIRYDKRELYGFPFRVVLRFHNLHWTDKDGISFTANTIAISARPWRWYHYKAQFKGSAKIEAPLQEAGQSLMLSSQNGEASVTLTPDGQWLDSKLDLENAEFGRNPTYIAAAQNISLSLQRPASPPTDQHTSGLDVQAEIDQLKPPTTIPSPFGDTIQKFAIGARVMGAVPDFRNPFSVKKWNDESGTVEFSHLNLEWGQLDMNIQGTIAFDDDLQPEGAFAGRLTEPKPVFQTLMDRGFIASRQSSMLDTALKLFAKPSTDRTGAPNAVDLPISVQLGSLYFGPVRILTFPSIEWPVMPDGGKVSR